MEIKDVAKESPLLIPLELGYIGLESYSQMNMNMNMPAVTSSVYHYLQGFVERCNH